MQQHISTQFRAFGRMRNKRTVEELNAKGRRGHLLRTARSGPRGQLRRSGARCLSRAIAWRNANWGAALMPANPVQRAQQKWHVRNKTLDRFQVRKMAWISVPLLVAVGVVLVEKSIFFFQKAGLFSATENGVRFGDGKWTAHARGYIG